MLKLLALATGLLAAAPSVFGHAYISNFYINGVDQGDGVCIRPYSSPRNYPVKDVESNDIRCGAGSANSQASKSCSVPAGATITVEWHHDARSSSDDIIASSHKGPCLAYLSKAGANQWFKIFQDGSQGPWCVDKVISNRGKLSFTIPSNLAPGQYDLRTELITLHEADTVWSSSTTRGVQVYVHCLAITVTGSGTGTGSPTVQFPGAYKRTDPGIHYNLYGGGSYTVPGPSVASIGGSSGGSTGGNTGGQTTTRASTTNGGSSGGSCAAKYAQCGGQGFTGPTCCQSGSTCKSSNQYYSQCL
ncbi:hypothetical protein HDV00_000700 [Rhizophlyctis rosea]|nr:hypothetical protein HDV00_000700 [Rhizophlyctis rosea]